MNAAKYGVKIVSDFIDFYDTLSSADGFSLVYNRNYGDANTRVQDMKYLQSMGIQTIQLKSARLFNSVDAEQLVIYTNDKKHCSDGKRVVSISEANLMYGNNLASKFHTEASGITNKFLQIGSRRFRLTLKNDTPYSITEGTLIHIQELQSDLNYRIGLPIFSIDYISTNEGMLAVDFNAVQNLYQLGMDKYITSEEVMLEIKKAILAYQKI